MIGGTQDRGIWLLNGSTESPVEPTDGGDCHIFQSDPRFAVMSYFFFSAYPIRLTCSLDADHPTWVALPLLNSDMNNEGYNYFNRYEMSPIDYRVLFCRTNGGLWRTTGTTIGAFSWAKLHNGTITDIYAILCVNNEGYFAGKSASSGPQKSEPYFISDASNLAGRPIVSLIGHAPIDGFITAIAKIVRIQIRFLSDSETIQRDCRQTRDCFKSVGRRPGILSGPRYREISRRTFQFTRYSRFAEAMVRGCFLLELISVFIILVTAADAGTNTTVSPMPQYTGSGFQAIVAPYMCLPMAAGFGDLK